MKLCTFTKIAFFPKVSMTCFYLTMTYINTILELIFFFPLRYSRTIVKNFPFRFQGPNLFSSLSNGIQNASSIAVFTSKLKSSFLISIFTSLSRLAYASFATFISFFPFLCLCAFARLVVLNYLFLPHHC